jgi:DNA-binding NtrC family response regulator
MDGVELLGVIKNRWPDTVRIMLTGHADLDTAISAVNRGGFSGC